MKNSQENMYDVIFIGAGISGPFIAHELCKAGINCLMLEAGKQYARRNYPRNDLDGASQLYWSGGLELGQDCKIAFLRPKVVGGGSVVNQALLERFDDDALDAWRSQSKVDFFTNAKMAKWYDKAESELVIQTVPQEFWNESAHIFRQGFEKLGYRYSPLRRACKQCHFEQGNCCIECLNGCRIGSKQSTPETVLKKALDLGLTLHPEVEATHIHAASDLVVVNGVAGGKEEVRFQGRHLVLAGGAIGNSRLLLNSGFDRQLPAVGRNFYCHPQYMNFGIYEKEVRAHTGAFGSVKSDDPGFRKSGFKLENVYAGPAGIAMLLGQYGRRLQQYMQRLSHFAGIEISVRDTAPGRITVNRKGAAVIHKKRNREDIARYKRGRKAVDEIFRATGATEIIHGAFSIALHLMGGCVMGMDSATSVVDSEFRLHGYSNIFAADSSIFPNAPGINPSLTIMALSKKAAEDILRHIGR
jgi:choline dehydrogenase-like flavoprotein